MRLSLFLGITGSAFALEEDKLGWIGQIKKSFLEELPQYGEDDVPGKLEYHREATSMRRPTWAHWSEWGECYRESNTWCLGWHARRRDCYGPSGIVSFDKVLSEEYEGVLFDQDTVCGAPRKSFSWSNEVIEGPIRTWENKTCHDRVCMIAYTQIPLWGVVSIAMAIGVVWEIVETMKRYYRYKYEGRPGHPYANMGKAILYKFLPCLKPTPKY
ncbi:Oidioi.mRNA.OKI2018_I69.XSR.g14975.t1.cds [Oikopleura dioica]|uniref:Oidioi.mRNA.OKI2018_I69.XSR.g14975.t1.cds n=1 Tax=Oikopleura dioica TaxID=34765 RepID=A0ABN7SBD5_OIKDI|nr:Oidioi.mRNA.OKI2018_I69.XSR.g14975.t1.cds [Oikopleura dioica]